MSNHLLAGAVIGALARRHPAAAFATGIASHLLLDACPHWGMPIDTPEDERAFLRVARCDGCCGLAIMAAAALAAGPPARLGVVAGMAGALLLDLDKPVRHFFGFELFPRAIQDFHERIQNESTRRMPQEIVVGLAGAYLASGVLRRTRGQRTRRKNARTSFT